MDAFVIQGGRRLSGRVRVNGSKNAALPLMAASLLTDQPLVLDDAPRLADIDNMQRLLDSLGVVSSRDERTPSRMSLRTTDERESHARYEIVRTMRASICTLGPMLARRGVARISMPGGCAIGDRPVDLHLRGMAALGAEITLDSGDIVAKAPRNARGKRRLLGARVFLGGPFGSTVLGTANVMCAAALADGRTIIECAACEPEIVDLATLLNAMGANIQGAGSPRIVIEGVEELSGATHRVMADRIEAGTYMMAAAITGGSITLENCPLDALSAAVDRLQHMGVSILEHPGPDRLRARCDVHVNGPLQPTQVVTQPHPGFPTDLQAQIMALLCFARGNSVVTEKIYPDRFLHVAELARMGAQTIRQGSTVVISGVSRLVGAPVMASDLRASASLVLAGMAAEGRTIINRVYHLDRGYERMETTLASLGAQIQRVDEKDLATLDAAPETGAQPHPGVALGG